MLFGTCMSLTWLRELLRERERWMWKSVPFQRQTVPSPQLFPGTLLRQGGTPTPPRYLVVSPFASHVDPCPSSLCPLHPRRISPGGVARRECTICYQLNSHKDLVTGIRRGGGMWSIYLYNSLARILRFCCGTLPFLAILQKLKLFPM